jgi:hypothetical protein
MTRLGRGKLSLRVDRSPSLSRGVSSTDGKHAHDKLGLWVVEKDD